MFKNFSINST